MTENVLLWVISGLCATILIFLAWIKSDLKDLWKRANNHGHQIECDGNACKPKTKGVIIHEE